MRGVLDALGVPPQRVPPELDAQVGLYRSLLAGRRVMVVLDNARDVGQVRPLLPGAAGCLALVTSRSQQTGLVAAAGARPITLDLLTADEARDLLARRLGQDRLAADPGATEEIITRCARLPLALAIVAARAATHPHFPLEAFATQLRDARGGLDALSVEDTATDVRAVFSWSYRTLSPATARLFRLLGLHPGPDIAAAAAASLAAAEPRQVRPLLAELCRAHLLTEHVPGRYTCHDLLRAYATELIHSEETSDDQRAALHRALDHYLHTARAADRLLFPHRYQIDVPPPEPGVTPQDVSEHQQALSWFIAERAVLLAAIDLAVDTGLDSYMWQLARVMDSFLAQQGHADDWAAVQRAALAAAARLTDEVAQALTHRTLARGYARLGRDDDAHTEYHLALQLFIAYGDEAIIGQAYAHRGLAWTLGRQQRYREALRHAERAAALFAALEDDHGHAAALNAVGWYHSLLGDHQQALVHCEQALAVLQQLGDRPVTMLAARGVRRPRACGGSGCLPGHPGLRRCAARGATPHVPLSGSPAARWVSPRPSRNDPRPTLAVGVLGPLEVVVPAPATHRGPEKSLPQR